MRHAVLAGSLFLVGGGLAMAARSFDGVASYALAVVAILATCGALELMGQVGLVSWPRLLAPRESLIGREPMPNVDVEGTTRQDTASLWGLPNDPMPFRYRTDRHGFRNPHDRTTADIYLLGDSILVGALVPSNQTIGALLEAATGRPVMQVALSGIAPQREHQLFSDLNVDVRGKLVMQFIFEGNDLLDSRAYRLTAQGVQPPSNSPWLVDQLWRMATNATDSQKGVSGLRVCMVGGQLYTFMWAKQSFQGLEEEAPHMAQAIEEFASSITRRGGSFALVLVPKKLRVLGPLCRFPAEGEIRDYRDHLGGLGDYLRDWSAARGISFLDLAPALAAAAQAGNIPWFWGDTHMNAAGHQVVADTLSAWAPLKAKSGAAH